jgi:hypothetical protein
MAQLVVLLHYQNLELLVDGSGIIYLGGGSVTTVDNAQVI